MTINNGWNAAYNSAKGSLLVGDGTRPEVRTVGTDGQVLTANSAQADGVEWATPSAGAAFTEVVIQYFPASATYTPTAGMKYCIVELIGGGGGGGGAAQIVTPGNVTVGGGGGAGEYARGVFDAATVGASQGVAIGAGGLGGIGVDGAAGGTSSFGVLMTAIGGDGGFAGLEGVNSIGFGGFGGKFGVGGTFHADGYNGENGSYYSVSGVGQSGAGANSQFSAGAVPFSALVGGGSGDGFPGGGFGQIGGAGGSGAINNDTGLTDRTGGDGSSGLCIITEFI